MFLPINLVLFFSVVYLFLSQQVTSRYFMKLAESQHRLLENIFVLERIKHWECGKHFNLRKATDTVNHVVCACWSRNLPTLSSPWNGSPEHLQLCKVPPMVHCGFNLSWVAC